MCRVGGSIAGVKGVLVITGIFSTRLIRGSACPDVRPCSAFIAAVLVVRGTRKDPACAGSHSPLLTAPRRLSPRPVYSPCSLSFTDSSFTAWASSLSRARIDSSSICAKYMSFQTTTRSNDRSSDVALAIMR